MVQKIDKSVYITTDGQEFETMDLAKEHEEFSNFKNFIKNLNFNPPNDIWCIDSIYIYTLWKIKDKLVNFLIENKYVDINKLMEE